MSPSRSTKTKLGRWFCGKPWSMAPRGRRLVSRGPRPHRDPLREKRLDHEQVPGVSGIHVRKELDVARMRLVKVNLLNQGRDRQWIRSSDVLALRV